LREEGARRLGLFRLTLNSFAISEKKNGKIPAVLLTATNRKLLIFKILKKIILLYRHFTYFS